MDKQIAFSLPLCPVWLCIQFVDLHWQHQATQGFRAELGKPHEDSSHWHPGQIPTWLAGKRAMSKRMSHPSCSCLGSRGWMVRRHNQDHSRCFPILSGLSSSPSCFSGDGEKRKSCQRQTTRGFQLCISVHLKDLTALFLQHLCLIFLHMQVFWSHFSSVEPLRSSADLTVYSLYPPHPGWVCKSLYWDKKCDGLFALPCLVAHLAIKWSNFGQVGDKPQTSSISSGLFSKIVQFFAPFFFFSFPASWAC